MPGHKTARGKTRKNKKHLRSESFGRHTKHTSGSLETLETNFKGGLDLSETVKKPETTTEDSINRRISEADFEIRRRQKESTPHRYPLDTRNSKSSIEELQHVWGEMNEQEREQLMEFSTNTSDELAKLFRLPELSEDNKKRFTKLLYEMVHLYGGDISDLMVGWVHDNKNYFDFFLSKNAVGDANADYSDEEEDESEPSLDSIDNLSTAIKAYILSRLTHRKNTGGNYNHILIRVTVDDGTERKSQWT